MEGLTLTTREQNRIRVLNGGTSGEVTVVQAAVLMEVSERHAQRLLAAYRKEGASVIGHGNRGRKPSTTTATATATDTQQRVSELAEGRYAGFNHTHLTEMLSEREGIDLSRMTVMQRSRRGRGGSMLRPSASAWRRPRSGAPARTRRGRPGSATMWAGRCRAA